MEYSLRTYASSPECALACSHCLSEAAASAKSAQLLLLQTPAVFCLARCCYLPFVRPLSEDFAAEGSVDVEGLHSAF